jgi:hypothetical protein
MFEARKIAEGAKEMLKSKFGLTSRANKKLFKKRMEICNVCPNRNVGIVDTCNLCGCVLEMKTRSVHSECPDELW